MQLLQHVVQAMDQNVYIYFDENSKEGVIIDPGDDAAQIIDIVEENGIKVKYILLTHGHSDHIGAIPEIKEKYDWPVAAHAWEVPVLEDEEANLSAMFRRDMSFTPDLLLQDGQELTVGGATIRVLHTPGHTIGGVCCDCPGDGIVFSGDTLFYGSVGRTDFPNPPVKNGIGYPTSENFDRLIRSIKEKLFVLPDNTIVYPGHGGQTRIGFEKQFNPFVKG